MSGVLLIGLTGGLAGEPAVSALRTSWFQNVTQAAGLQGAVTLCGTREKRFIVEGNGSGCAWLDYDLDGWSDLFIAGGMDLGNLTGGGKEPGAYPNYLFRNKGDGTFSAVTQRAGVSGTGRGNGAFVADYDGDGYPDIFITSYGPDLLYRNRGDGTFQEVAVQAGVSGGDAWSMGATFGDFDLDGWLDLYVARYLDFDFEHPPLEGEFCTFRGLAVMCGPRGLPATADVLYRNNGDGTFSNISESSGISAVSPRYGFSALFEDFDNDGFPDLLVTNDSGPNFLFHNKEGKGFEEVGLLSGVAYNRNGQAQANMGLAVGDVGGDGLMDIFITTFAEDYYPFFENEGNLTFVENSQGVGLAVPTMPFLGWSTFFFDADNDGILDLYAASGHLYPQADQMEGRTYRQADFLFRGTPGGTFENASEEAGFLSEPIRSSRGAAFSDYDRDGDLDLVVLAIDDSPLLLRNDVGNRNNWLELRLLSRSGSDRIGATASIRSGDLVQHDRVRSGGNYLSSNEQRLHFGLGRHDRVDRLEILWPGGKKVDMSGVPANQILTVREE